MTFKMNHVHLKTKDPEATAKFYVDTLGATELRTRLSKHDRTALRTNEVSADTRAASD